MNGGQVDWTTESYADCIKKLEENHEPTAPMLFDDTVAGILLRDSPWCNATWDDEELCWPAVPANTNYSRHCPQIIPGITTEDIDTRFCNASGHWIRSRNNFSCLHSTIQSLEFFYKRLEEILEKAHHLEYATVASILFIIIVLVILRKVQYFKNGFNKQLLRAYLAALVIRFFVHLDHSLHQDLSELEPECRLISIIYDFSKLIPVTFLFLEIYWVYKELTSAIDNQQSRITLLVYEATGWGVSITLTIFYLLIRHNVAHSVTTIMQYLFLKYLMLLFMAKKFISRCHPDYVLHHTNWILVAEQIAGTSISGILLLHLWHTGYKLNQKSSNLVDWKKLQFVTVLFPLIAMSSIMELFHFFLTSDFASYAIKIYSAVMFRSLQGFMIALVYLFFGRKNDAEQQVCFIALHADEPGDISIDE